MAPKAAEPASWCQDNKLYASRDDLYRVPWGAVTTGTAGSATDPATVAAQAGAPDPLAGETPENPPLWIVKAAEKREPFVSYGVSGPVSWCPSADTRRFRHRWARGCCASPS